MAKKRVMFEVGVGKSLSWPTLVSASTSTKAKEAYARTQGSFEPAALRARRVI